MGNLQFGVALPAVTGIAEFAQQAEELGFDFLACGEHVMFHGPVANTFISLSVAAGATQRAARYATGWIPYMYTPQQLKESLDTIARLGKEYGRDMSTFIPGLFIFSAVHANSDEARQMAAERLGRNYAQDFSKLVNRYALAGTPEECQKRLKEYLDAGAQTVIFPLACRPEYVSENLRLLANEVIPAFR